uniref:Uncharacterized protein n=1 Tax=Pyxicephalus adspersus TaxID=30357 RepID=A0AAV3B283_PYXAD|nr:TPA: hypothetical protein GDO54_002046 [Pyxicephalus adspersus]
MVSKELQEARSFSRPDNSEIVQSTDTLQCSQLVQPYGSPHQQFADPEKTQLVQKNSSLQSITSPKSLHVNRSYANLEDSQINQPYASSEHKLDQPIASPELTPHKTVANSEHPPVTQPYTVPQTVQSASSDCPQVVQPYDSSDHSQFVQLYDSSERPQLKQPHLLQSCGSPAHPKNSLQFGTSGESLELVKPHANLERSQLDQPYSSPKHSQLDQSHVMLEKMQLNKMHTSIECMRSDQPLSSPKNQRLAQPCIQHENSQLVQLDDKQEHPQSAQPYDSPEHLQLVQPISNAQHPQLVESYASPEHSPLMETYSGMSHPQLAEKYSSAYHNSSLDLSLNLKSSCLDDNNENHKLMQSPVSDSRFDNSLQCDTKASVSQLEVPCSSLAHKKCFKSSQPHLEKSCKSSHKISEGLPITQHKSLLDESTESPVRLVLKKDYDQFLTGNRYSSDSTQLDGTSSSKQLELDHSSNLTPPEQSSSNCSGLLPDKQQLGQKLSSVEDYSITHQPQTFPEHTDLQEYSSSVSCLNKGCLSTSQHLMKASNQPLKDTCLDFPQASPVETQDCLEQPSMPLLDSDVSLIDGTISSQETLLGSIEGGKNSSTILQQLTDRGTKFKVDPPDRLASQSDDVPDKACLDISLQNKSLESYSYSHSENKSYEPGQSVEDHIFMCVKERTPRVESEQIDLDAEHSKNEQMRSPEIIEVPQTTAEKTFFINSPLFSPKQNCNKPLTTVLSAETEEASTNMSLQLQDKVDCHLSAQVSLTDNVQIDHECKIKPPDLLPFDSEQPTHVCLNSESSEPVLFISQPPPELLPYDSEQPSNPFQNTSDYSSEQDSSVFHTPPELLPYDSDQTAMLISKPDSCKEKLSFYESSDGSHKSSFASSVTKETNEEQLSSAQLDCVKYETSRSSVMTCVSDSNNSEKLVDPPVTTFLDAEQALPFSQSSCNETKFLLEQPFLKKMAPHPLDHREHSVEHSQLIEDSVKSSLLSVSEVEQESLISNTCDPFVMQSCSSNSELGNLSPLEKATVTQAQMDVSKKRSRSKSLSKTELSHALSTSSKRSSPLKHTSRSVRSHSRSDDRKKSRSKSTTRKKRSRSKSVSRKKKSRSSSVIKTRKSRSKSAPRRKKSLSVSDTRLRRSRSRSVSRKRRSRSTSVAQKRSSHSPSVAKRRRSRSRRKRSHSTSVDHKRSHSNSVARKRRSRSRSSARRRRSRSSSVHRRKRSRSSSVARRRRSRSSSITCRRRSRSSSIPRRRHSPSQSVTRRKRSPSLGRRRRSRSPSVAQRRRSRSASRRRRSRSPSISRRRHSPSAPRRRRSRSPSPRKKRSSSAVRKRHSRSTSATRKRRSRSSSRKRRSRSSTYKRHSETPSVACKRRSESKSPTPKSPKNKQRAPSKSDRSRSRSQSNIIRKRKTRSRSTSRDKSKSNDKRRKRSSSKEHYSIKQRRKSRTPSRRKKSRSPVRRVSPCRSPVRRRRSRSPVRRKSFSRSPVRRKRSRSRDQSMDSARSPKRLTDLDKAQLLEIAKANAAAMCAKAGMPLPPSLKPVLAPSAPVDEKVTQRTYGVTIQELTEKCKQIAQSKEDDEVVNKPHDSDEEEDDKPFYNHPFKVSEHKPISFSLLNPSLKPAPKNQVTLTKEFPVSSGSQHRKKESDKVYGEWVPVDKKTEESKDDVFTNTGPSQPVDITAAMNERAMAQTRLTGNPFDLEALLMLNRAQEQIDAWAQSTSLPGQFTGSTGAQVLSADEISNSGPQAWLKKVCSRQTVVFA